MSQLPYFDGQKVERNLMRIRVIYTWTARHANF